MDRTKPPSPFPPSMCERHDRCQERIPVRREGTLHGSDQGIWMSMSMSVLHYGISSQRPVVALDCSKLHGHCIIDIDRIGVGD